MAHRKVVLGAMARTLGAFAPRLAAAFVTLDERAAQDRLERGQLAQKRLAPSSQGGNWLVFDFHQTTCITGLIVLYENTFFNPFVPALFVDPVGQPARKASPHRAAAVANRASCTETDRPSLSIRAQC